MEEVVRAFLSTSVGKAIFVVLIVIVGFILREWTHRNRYGYNHTWNKTRGADLRREEKNVGGCKRKYAYLNKNSNNRSKGSIENIRNNILSWLRKTN